MAEALQTADPSTAFLAIKPQEASLRMTLSVGLYIESSPHSLLKRQLATGDYAEVGFLTRSIRWDRIVLLPGDEVDWLMEKRRPAGR
jgi:hypothetical protein